MGSTCAFKISASIIKPSRESLLDYCSYTLIIISLIGILRVLIGSSSLRYGCWDSTLASDSVDGGFSGDALSLDYLSKDAVAPMTVKPPIKNDFVLESFAEDQERNSSVLVNRVHVFAKEPRSGGLPESKEEDKKDVESVWERNITEYRINDCPKYYQSLFAYILLIESMLLLLSGMLWAKVPRVSPTLRTFSDLVQICRTSDWAEKALRVVTNKRINPDVSHSLYSIMSSENDNYDMRFLLDTLFHPDSEYHAKAKARHLYEKVQTFSLKHNEARDLWSTYIIKSIAQFALWIIIFNINLVLFVILQFYVVCSDELDSVCNHDEFLRIIWFMGEIVLLIYGVFNCKTLKWINEKAIVTRRLCNCCTWRFSEGHTILDNSNKVPRLVCRLYRYGCNQPVFNDMALLMHLMEESHPKILPYLVVFMFNEWKEKLTSFATAVQISEFPIRSSMQMLSGRPPPIIEVTDVTTGLQSPPAIECDPKNKPQSGTSRPKQSVTFYFETESGASSEVEMRRERLGSTGSHSSRSDIGEEKSNLAVRIPSPPSPCPFVKATSGTMGKVKSTNIILEMDHEESLNACDEAATVSDELLHKSEVDGSEMDEETSLLHDVGENFLESVSSLSKSDSESNSSKTRLVEDNTFSSDFSQLQ